MKRISKISLYFISCILVVAIIASCDKCDCDCIDSGRDRNIIWKLSKDGVLTIRGKGNMPDYYYDDEINWNQPPWYDHRNSFTALIIEEGITSIGSYAFIFCNEFTGSLNLPESLTSIGSYAFYRCEGFTGSLILPEGIKDIGERVFSFCSGFTGNLILPDDIRYIPDGVFSGCSGFTGNLTLPDSLKFIGEYAFAGCTGFSSLTFSANPISFSSPSWAFNYWIGLTDVINYSIEPQGIYDVFDATPINTITLHVPEISLEKYSESEVWKDFGSIVAIENY